MANQYGGKDESPIPEILATLDNLESHEKYMKDWERNVATKRITDYKIYINEGTSLPKERKEAIGVDLDGINRKVYNEPKGALGELSQYAVYLSPEIEKAEKIHEADIRELYEEED